MSFLSELIARNTSAMPSLTRQDEPNRTVGYVPQITGADIRADRVSRELAARNRVTAFNSPNEMRMWFSTTNRPTQVELIEFERQFLGSISPRVPLSEIRTTTNYEAMNNSYLTVLSSQVAYSPNNSESVVIKAITAEKILKTMPCCLYGSRGIGLENADDFDIAISIEDPKYLAFINYLENVGVKRIDIKNYANSTPESGYYGLYRFEDANGDSIDLLVLYLDEDVDVIRSTITDLKRIPPYFLNIKKQRIAMYNQGLRYRGWKEGVKVHEKFVRNSTRSSTSYNRPGTIAENDNRSIYAQLFGPRDSERWED